MLQGDGQIQDALSYVLPTVMLCQWTPGVRRTATTALWWQENLLLCVPSDWTFPRPVSSSLLPTFLVFCSPFSGCIRLWFAGSLYGVISPSLPFSLSLSSLSLGLSGSLSSFLFSPPLPLSVALSLCLSAIVSLCPFGFLSLSLSISLCLSIYLSFSSLSFFLFSLSLSLSPLSLSLSLLFPSLSCPIPSIYIYIYNYLSLFHPTYFGHSFPCSLFLSLCGLHHSRIHTWMLEQYRWYR